MKDILLESADAVAEGARFKVDLVRRNLIVNKKKIIDNGKYEGCLGVDTMTTEEFVDIVTILYRNYLHSVPSERSEKKHKTYFKALPECELSDDDMVRGERRDVAQCVLEVFILACVLNGTIKWEELEKRNGFFWQSKEEKGLVIFKEWVFRS